MGTAIARIAIVGAGYVGLCTGLVFAKHGHTVTFVDANPKRLEALRNGQAPFFEPGVPQLLAEMAPRLKTVGTIAAALQDSEFAFLCVGTPQSPDGAIDLSYIRGAAKEIGQAVKGRKEMLTVVVKSTVVPGTAEDAVQGGIQAASGQAPGTGYEVASNPEFLKEGSAMQDALHPDRIVVGARQKGTADRVLSLYAAFTCPKIVVDPPTAEMIKYAANAFLAVRIALSNELGNASERLGIDWYQVAEGIGHDKRIGPLFLRAGVGFGGSCFPKDVAAIAYAAEAAGAPSRLLAATLDHNERQPEEAVRMLREELGDLRGKRVALLGLAFKADTDDVRETRALPLHRALVAAGAQVVCHDPQGGPNFLALEPTARLAATVDEALRGVDAAVVQTEWAEYRAIPPARLKTLMARPIVVDGRRTFDPAAMRSAGVRYRGIGLGSARPMG